MLPAGLGEAILFFFLTSWFQIPHQKTQSWLVGRIQAGFVPPTRHTSPIPPAPSWSLFQMGRVAFLRQCLEKLA